MLGQPVVVEADIRNAWHNTPDMFNVVGEIRGTEFPDEVVCSVPRTCPRGVS
jgi:hypothetical protein